MKKVNILIIFSDHFRTLVDARTGRISLTDIFLFFGFPAILSAWYCFSSLTFQEAVISALIAVFSVFSALLFSAQIALYGLSPKVPSDVGDRIEHARLMEQFRREKKFFSDVNSNISYLILLSCICLILFVVFIFLSISTDVSGPLIIFLVSHFFLTLLMLVKRSHVAFSSRHKFES